jgi:chromate transporter
MAVNTSVLLDTTCGAARCPCVRFRHRPAPLIILSIISVGYTAFIHNKIVANVLCGMRAGVCAVIIDVVIDMSRATVRSKNIVSILLMIAAFAAVAFLHVNVIVVILIGAMVGLLSCAKKRGKGADNDLS